MPDGFVKQEDVEYINRQVLDRINAKLDKSGGTINGTLVVQSDTTPQISAKSLTTHARLGAEAEGANALAGIRLRARNTSADVDWYIDNRGGVESPNDRLAFRCPTGAKEVFRLLDSGGARFWSDTQHTIVTIESDFTTGRARLDLDSLDDNSEIYFSENGSLKHAISYPPASDYLGFWNQTLNSGSGDWAWYIQDSDGHLVGKYNATDGSRAIRIYSDAANYGQLSCPAAIEMRICAPGTGFVSVEPGGDTWGLVVRDSGQPGTYWSNIKNVDGSLYIGTNVFTVTDMVKIWNSGTDNGLVQVPSTLYIQNSDTDKPCLVIGSGSNRITSSMYGFEIYGGSSSAIFSIQDGNGRIQLKWNATTGTAETYLIETTEKAIFWDWTIVSDPYFEMKHAPTGTGTITWTTHMAIYDSGAIECSPDKDLTFVFGRTAIGHSSYSDYAAISHYERRATAGQYALIQNAAGTITAVNAVTGGTVYLRVNNANRAYVDGTNFVSVGEAYKLNQTTNPMNAIIWKTSFTDIAGGLTESTSWADFTDLTTHTSSNAKGVILNFRCSRLCGTGGSVTPFLQFRKNGQASGLHVEWRNEYRNDSGGNMTFNWSFMIWVPCDAGQIIEWRVDHTSTTVENCWVRGYWE
jgi:hypothetical protein